SGPGGFPQPSLSRGGAVPANPSAARGLSAGPSLASTRYFAISESGGAQCQNTYARGGRGATQHRPRACGRRRATGGHGGGGAAARHGGHRPPVSRPAATRNGRVRGGDTPQLRAAEVQLLPAWRNGQPGAGFARVRRSLDGIAALSFLIDSWARLGKGELCEH